ncbi:uncharacterized protein N7459_008096 [Penicillium hispanicum]|uniref:uncharacterized protein n=1 Tax=Penicillium hispanicum TaxID=1080232 RepID=UPI002541F59E|nr:uncharacterized protein N7459_008096 [Penicillium hispanicum]KAJ5573669.1 hypothetical protein N7459_008096 [Penicillium hispanicum]
MLKYVALVTNQRPASPNPNQVFKHLYAQPSKLEGIPKPYIHTEAPSVPWPSKMLSSTTSTQRIPPLSRSSDARASAERWQAITKRDASIDSFVYAVITTRIYCRPSCPARRARRANVQFYDTPSQAEKAGFRACKRCRPESGRTAVQSNPQVTMVGKACDNIQAELAAGLKPRLHDLAARAGLTPSHFHRVFKKQMGVTPGQYASALVQKTAPPLGDSLTPDTMSHRETSRFDIVEAEAEGALELDCDLSAIEMEKSSSLAVNEAWNEFDALLADEQGQGWFSDWLSIDPRLIGVSD